jgi:hypothetical protein
MKPSIWIKIPDDAYLKPLTHFGYLFFQNPFSPPTRPDLGGARSRHGDRRGI